MKWTTQPAWLTRKPRQETVRAMAAAPDRPSQTARNAQVVVAVILSGAALYWMAPILTPLALAVFLMLMIDGLARTLKRRLPISDDALVGVAIVLCIVGFIITVFFVGSNGAAFVG